MKHSYFPLGCTNRNIIISPIKRKHIDITCEWTCVCRQNVGRFFHYLFFSVFYLVSYSNPLKLLFKFQQPSSVCKWNEFNNNLCYRLRYTYTNLIDTKNRINIHTANKQIIPKLMKCLTDILSQAYYCCT